MNLLAHQTVLGPSAFTALSEGDVVVAAGFTADANQLAFKEGYASAEIKPASSHHPVSRSVAAYIRGDLDSLAAVAVKPQGSATMLRMWKRLHRIPAGATVSYAELGGERRYSRVAATACARNPIALFIPCHRVVRSDGGLGGFGGGLDTKAWLLDHEGVKFEG